MLFRSPCIPRDSQESSPTTQFKTINSSALSFLYNPTLTSIHQFSSVQSLNHVHSLQPHGLQYTSLAHPSPTSGACANSCPSSWGCHPTISSFDVPISSCLQSFPESGSFPMSQFFTSGGSSIVSASASALPMNIQD